MKPTTNGHKYPKFSVKESRAKLSQSIIEIYSNLMRGLILSGNFNSFKEILVQVNKAVLGMSCKLRRCNGINQCAWGYYFQDKKRPPDSYSQSTKTEVT